MKARAVGKRGDWFATVNGERLPCVHAHWTKGIWPHHADPGVDGRRNWREFITAIESGKRVILTTDHVNADGTLAGRKEYVAIYRVDNVAVYDDTLHFDFTDRLAELR
jgi:hypothetical protein